VYGYRFVSRDHYRAVVCRPYPTIVEELFRDGPYHTVGYNGVPANVRTGATITGKCL